VGWTIAFEAVRNGAARVRAGQAVLTMLPPVSVGYSEILMCNWFMFSD
jgi:hypothetical protein